MNTRMRAKGGCRGTRRHARTRGEGLTHSRSWITYYIPPLQLHVLLAGITLAVAIGALGLTFRRWSQAALIPGRERIETRLAPEPHSEPPRPPAGAGEPPAPAVPVVIQAPRPELAVYPGRFWLIAAGHCSLHRTGGPLGHGGLEAGGRSGARCASVAGTRGAAVVSRTWSSRGHYRPDGGAGDHHVGDTAMERV